jgi:hypothetical protein
VGKGDEVVVEYFRGVEEVVYSDRLAFPFKGLCPDFDEPRNFAIIEVLRRIPEADLQELDKFADTFIWYTTHYEILAAVMPFYSTHPGGPLPSISLSFEPYAKVLYLSPLLADVDPDVAVAAVAHEPAHIILDHKPDNLLDEEYERQENEAWDLVRKWGFAEEAKAHKRYRSEREQGAQDITCCGCTNS